MGLQDASGSDRMSAVERLLWTLTLVLLCGFLFFTVSAMFYRFLDTSYLVLYAATHAAAMALTGGMALVVTNNRVTKY